MAELARGHASLEDPEARAAFVNTLRTIVDPLGQRVNATDRLYLAENIPFLLVWGERDPIIPVEHGLAAHELVPSSRLELFEDAGHFPHLDEPQRFLDVLLDFIESTDPADLDPERVAGDAEDRPTLAPPATCKDFFACRLASATSTTRSSSGRWPIRCGCG